MSIGIVMATLLVSVAAGLAIAPRAQATATIALSTPRTAGVVSAGSQGDASLARYTAQRARFVTSDAVMQAVAEELGRSDITTLRRDVTATPAGNSNTITITAEASSASGAVALAGAVVDAYRAESGREVERLTDAALATIDQSVADIRAGLGPQPAPELVSSVASTLSQLQIQANDLATSSALFGDGVEFVVEPRLDAVSTAGRPIREAALGIVLGVVIAATIAWLRADRDRGVTSPLQPEAILDVPLLGELRAAPDLSPGDSRVDLDAMPSRDFRVVWSALLRMVRRAPTGVLLVTATGPVARSTTALSVAVAAARENLSVLIVDADVENAWLSASLEVPDDAGGLRQLLLEGGDYRRQVLEVDLGGVQSLSVLPAGRVSAGDVNVSTQMVEQQVAAWRDDYDLVVVDADQVGSGQLPSALSGAVDSLLVVIPKGTDERSLEELRRMVGLQGTPMIGYIYAASVAGRAARVR